MTDSATYLSQFHQLLNEHFNLAEIRALCHDLNVDYEGVPGEEKLLRIRELIGGLARNGRLPELLTLAQQQRPQIAWPPLPHDFVLPESLASGDLAVPGGQQHLYGDLVQGDKVAGDKVAGDKIIYAAGATAVYQGLSVEEVAALLVELKDKDQPKTWDGRIPYLGLTAFQEDDAQFFFGRESLVEELLERVQQANFITLAGSSGSGKSSVIRAGLFHTLRQGQLEKSSSWLLAALLPKGNPIEQLALALERATKSRQIGNIIREQGLVNPAVLQQEVEIYLTDDPQQRCVILVDQFEEIFTQTKDESLRAAFIDLLTTTARAEASRVIILLALRSDFVSHCTRYPELRAFMSRQMQLVGAMDPPDLAKAITLPALEVGARLDPELVSRIIAEMKGEPGALPLMSFALRDLFGAEKTTPGQPMDLTLAEYLQRGGVDKALEQHANLVLNSFSKEQKALARSVFAKLIEIGHGRAHTRRTVPFQELVPAETDPEAVAAVVNTLAQESVRLLTAGSEEAAGGEISPTVTLAHEKLIDAWPWLRQLVDENQEIIALQNQISDDAQKWDKEGDAGFLYRGGRLLQVVERLDTMVPGLNARSQAFIQASIHQQQREVEEKEAQQRRELEAAQKLTRIERQRAQENHEAEKIQRQRATYLLFALVAALGTTIIAIVFAVRASRNENIARDALATIQASGVVVPALGALATEEALSNPDIGGSPTPLFADPALAGGRRVVTEGHPIAVSIGEFVRVGTSSNISQLLRPRLVEAVSTALSDLDLDDNVGYVNWESLQVGPIRGATIEEVDRSAGSVSSSVTLELIFYGVIVANIDSVRILLRHQRNCSVAALSLPETPFPHFFSAGALGEDLVIPADASEQKLDETVVILAERIMAEIGTTADICYPYSR